MRDRPRILAVALVMGVTCLATPFAAAATGGERSHTRSATGDGDDDGDLIEEGRSLYATGCSSCHGADGSGIEPRDGGAGGPSLVDTGEAGAYFQLSTGRMPAASSDEQPQRKEPAYSPHEIDALVAFVASLGDGPPLPDVDLSDADLAAGGMIFRADCQACHSAAGSGGALSYGSAAPRLEPATPEQIAAAVRIGPGQMPVFDTDIISDDGLNDLVSYVRYLDHPADPGGLPIGRTGPIPEGFVAWLVGMVALIGLVTWIGTRAPLRSAAGPAGAAEGAEDLDPPGSGESAGSAGSGEAGGLAGSGEAGGLAGSGEVAGTEPTEAAEAADPEPAEAEVERSEPDPEPSEGEGSGDA